MDNRYYTQYLTQPQNVYQSLGVEAIYSGSDVRTIDVGDEVPSKLAPCYAITPTIPVPQWFRLTRELGVR